MVKLPVLFCVENTNAETLTDFQFFHLQLVILAWLGAHHVHTWEEDLEFNSEYAVALCALGTVFSVVLCFSDLNKPSSFCSFVQLIM